MTVLPARVLSLTVLLAVTAFADSDADVTAPTRSLEEAQSESPGMAVARAAEVKAVGWVMSRMTQDFGWGEDTAHTVLALALANASWILDPSNLEAQLVTKQFELELVLRLWRHHEVPLTTGHLALNIMTLVALCRDPRAFHSKDLVSLLEHQDGIVDFEVAFGQLAVCSAGRKVRKRSIRTLLSIIADQRKIHSIDTLSVTLLALHCAQKRRHHDLLAYTEQAIDVLLKAQAQDGSFGGNLHTTALALQALLASDLGGSWNATLAQEYLMSHQRADGSFGGLFDTNAVLPLLVGRTLLGVGDQPCLMQPHYPRHRTPNPLYTDEINEVEFDEGEMAAGVVYERFTVEPATSVIPPPPPTMINVTYIIWIGNSAQQSFNLTLSVPVNTSFFSIMKTAAEADPRFEFSASRWANGYYIHTISGQREQKVGYWFWLLYRLTVPPVPGTKPDNKFVVGTGVQETFPSDGDYMLFWYHKI
ncbi:uncharacterized protein CG3556-like [Hyalella azteca]|uniref:Uncharacterized protein CG3556-like n=1 Tax=Hyalella azteca TaxID=294128 RepID=A0A8B7NES4_HYAAZ|nr:uncharacterized protein CG3556-like [Hyalella azteca]